MPEMQPALATAARPVLASPRKILSQFWHLVLVAFLAWLSYDVINHYLLSTVRVTGVSMRPTLKDSDVYLLNRWLYLVRQPKPGDIVVIKDPGDDGLSIKRVIAGPPAKVYAAWLDPNQPCNPWSYGETVAYEASLWTDPTGLE